MTKRKRNVFDRAAEILSVSPAFDRYACLALHYAGATRKQRGFFEELFRPTAADKDEAWWGQSWPDYPADAPDYMPEEAEERTLGLLLAAEAWDDHINGKDS